MVRPMRPAETSSTRRKSRAAITLLLCALGIAAAAVGCSSNEDATEKVPSPDATESADKTRDLDSDAPVVKELPADVALPIVFVHGFAGSAQQYETQAIRFIDNGYPAERIVAYDHDGAGMDITGYANGVDKVVDEVLASTGAKQVYLVGHSRGTMVSTSYLADPARAAKVAKYIAIDGRECVEVVPCLAPNQDVLPGQAHVEAATSAESFAMQYEFLVGDTPEIIDPDPQDGPVVLEGRAVNFPANTGRAGATLDIWEIDADSGARIGDEPHASIELGSDGEFGPLEVTPGAHYEYALSQPDSDVIHHVYLQPYYRSSHLVRLLSSAPDGSTRVNTNSGPDHSSIIAIRMREWYGVDDEDLPGDQTDVLNIRVDGGEPVDVVAGFDTNGAIGLHIHDDAASPGKTTLGPLPYFSEQPFQQGIDLFMPSSPEGTGTISITNLPRGDASKPQTLNVPNWPSETNAISVVFTDYPVD